MEGESIFGIDEDNYTDQKTKVKKLCWEKVVCGRVFLQWWQDIFKDSKLCHVIFLGKHMTLQKFAEILKFVSGRQVVA